MTPGHKIAVLLDDTKAGYVIGYAVDAAEAAIVWNANAAEAGDDIRLAACDFRRRREPIAYDPDINTLNEVATIDSHGAWAPIA